MGHADPQPEIPCTTCELYLTMKRDGNWIAAKEVQRPAGSPAILTSIMVEPRGSEATHADVFVAPGHDVNPVLLAGPPRAERVRIGEARTVLFPLAPGGEYTIYALPKRLDPAFRIHYPAMTPVTAAITVAQRPIAQEFRIGV